VIVDQPDNNLTDLVEPACRMVARGDIATIAIVPPCPVKPDNLRRLEAFARARAVALALDDDGTIILRGGAPTQSRARSADLRRWLRWSLMPPQPVRPFQHGGAGR
jgi:hypothetical protein